MTARRFIWIALGIVLALSFAGRAMLRSQPRGEPAPGELTVTLASPRGEVARLYSVDVLFSSAMKPLGERGPSGPVRADGKKIPLEIDPPIEGSATWIGTRALSFAPREPVPAASRLTCKVPAGTRALDGSTLPSDVVWEIFVRPPRLLRSVPEDASLYAPGETIYLLFNAPVRPGAEDSVRFAGPDGPIPLTRVAPDSAAIVELLGRRGPSGPIPTPEEAEQRGLLALRPTGTVPPAASLSLEIAPGIPLGAGEVGLEEPVEVSFASYGPPRFVDAQTGPTTIDLTLGGPVDPEALRENLQIEPPVPNLAIDPRSGTEFHIRGRIRSGTTYTLTLRAGLTSLLGARLETADRLTVATAHDFAELSIVPSSGYLLRTDDPRIRIEGVNVDSVTIRGAWVPADSMPSSLAHETWEPPLGPLPLLGRWGEPAATPDSLRAIHLDLSRFGKRPKGAQAVRVQVRSRALFPDPSGERETLRGEALLQITDLGISAIAAHEKSLVWVTRLSTGKPAAGATVRLWLPGRRRPLGSATSDADGMAWLPGVAPLSRGDRPVIEVRTESDAAWIRVSPEVYQAGSEAGPEFAGAPPAGYVFTDRPLYRPGEAVSFVAHVRRSGSQGIAGAGIPAVHYEVSASEGGTVIGEGELALAPPGDGSLTVTLPADAPLGYYAIALTLPRAPQKETPESKGQPGGDEEDGGGRRAYPVAYGGFQVEEYRLPRFEAAVRGPAEPVIAGEEATVTGRFAYLGGGPLGGVPVRWTVSRSAYWEAPEGYEDYQFTDERPRGMEEVRPIYGMDRVAAGEGTLDKEGRIAIHVTPDMSGLGADQTYMVEMGARDLADRSAYDVGTFTALRAGLRAGIRTESFPAAGEEPERVQLAAIALDPSGKPLAGVPLTLRIEKRLWRTVRVRRIGSAFGYENVPQDSLVSSEEAASGSEPVVRTFTPRSPGTYSFVVEARDDAGRFTSARSFAYVAGRSAAGWYRGDQAWLELKPDERKYMPGDTAQVLVPAPAIPTEALVLISDNGIQRARRLSGLRGAPRVAVPLAPYSPPAVWMQAILVGPTVVPEPGGAIEHLPYYGWGQTALTMSLDPWKLDFDVTTDRAVYEPGNEVTIVVTGGDAARAAGGKVTLAVVDDAIFQLSGEPSVDPWNAIFQWRGPGTDYKDVRQDLHLPARGEKGRITPGGDGGEEGGGPRKRFVPTAAFAPLLPIGADGRAVYRFRLPDDLTRFRVRALASAGVDLFGYEETKFDVRKGLQLEWSAPRFVRDGDRLDLVAVARNNGPEKIDARVSVSVRGARIDGKAEKKLSKIPAGGGARAVFTIRDPAAPGIEVTMRAQAGGGLEDAATFTIPFEKPVLWERDFLAARLEPSYRTTIALDRTAIPDLGGLTTTIGPSLLSGIGPALASTIDYPYGCLEQLSSSLLAAVAARTAAQHLGEEPDSLVGAGDAGGAGGAEGAGSRGIDLETRAKRASEQMAAAVQPWMVLSWPDMQSPPASDYVVGYALLAATHARAAGLPFPEEAWSRLDQETARRLESAWSGWNAWNEQDRRGRDRSGGSAEPEEGGLEPGGEPEAGGFDRPRDHGESSLRQLRETIPWLLFAQTESERLAPGAAAGAGGAGEAVEAGAAGQAAEPRARRDDLESLFARHGELPLPSRIVLALALQNRAESETGEPKALWSGYVEAIVGEVLQSSLQRTGRFVWIHEEDETWADGMGSDEEATAFFLRLLAAHDPQNEQIPGLVSWLLDRRRPSSGMWASQHASALVLDVVTSTVARLEGPLSQVTGQVAVGERFEPFRFTGGDRVVRSFFPLADLFRMAGTNDAIPLRGDSDGRRTVYLTATLDVAHPALDAGSVERGMILSREWVDAAGRPYGDRLPLAEPLYVHLAIVAPRDARMLAIEDPLPAGVEAVNLAFANAPKLSLSETPDGAAEFSPAGGDYGMGYGGGGGGGEEGGGPYDGGEGGGELWIVHKELRDRRVLAFAEDVRAGIYHLYYPAVATVAGTYRVPGARVEMMYSPEIYATTPATTVRVEEKTR